MRLAVTCILGVFFSFQSLVPTSVLDNKVQILLPTDFEVMSEEMLQAKYPTNLRPTLVYSDEFGTVNIAINHTNNQMTLDKLPDALGVFIQHFQQLYPSAQWSRKETTQINGRDFVVLELITPAVDTDIYNLMFVTSLEGRMLLFSFNCTLELQSEWESVGNQIMESVKVF